MRTTTFSPILSILSLSLVFLAVSAAPFNDHGNDGSGHAYGHDKQNVHEKVQHIWSAIQLWLYRLLHGGKYPPGFNAGGGGGEFTSTVSVPAQSASAFSSLASSAFASASASVFTSSVYSSAPTSTSSSSAAIATSTTSPSNGFLALPASNPTVCSAQAASSFPLSCSADSFENTCCTESPGGHILLTQFYNTGSSSTGPNNTWTMHGLWPDNCDGTYEANCDPSRELANITSVLEQYQQDDLLAYMDVNWKDYQGNDESFWEHEYNKHGTCLSTLEPRCFNNYTPQQEAVYYFRRAVELHKQLDTYAFLAAAGIYPSLTQTYTLEEITNAVQAGFGGEGEANINCKSGVFQEVWYHYELRGSVVDGDFIPAKLVGSPSSCPAAGIHYYPKYVEIPKASSTATGSAATPASTGSGSSGFLYAVSADETTPSGTCLISAGAWFKGGTCASFRLTEITGGSYTLTSSKGLCAVDPSSKLFSCAESITSGSNFLIDDNGLVTLGGSSAFSAANVPASNEKVNVYQGTSQALPVTLKFVNK